MKQPGGFVLYEFNEPLIKVLESLSKFIGNKLRNALKIMRKFLIQ